MQTRQPRQLHDCDTYMMTVGRQGRVDFVPTYILMAIQVHRVNQPFSLSLQHTSVPFFLFLSRTFPMGPPATPSAGMPQYGRSNGGYTVYGGAHQGRQGVQPRPLPQINAYYHSHGQNSPIYAVSAQPGRPVAVRRYRPGH